MYFPFIRNRNRTLWFASGLIHALPSSAGVHGCPSQATIPPAPPVRMLPGMQQRSDSSSAGMATLLAIRLLGSRSHVPQMSRHRPCGQTPFCGDYISLRVIPRMISDYFIGKIDGFPEPTNCRLESKDVFALRNRFRTKPRNQHSCTGFSSHSTARMNLVHRFLFLNAMLA